MKGILKFLFWFMSVIVISSATAYFISKYVIKKQTVEVELTEDEAQE